MTRPPFALSRSNRRVGAALIVFCAMPLQAQICGAGQAHRAETESLAVAFTTTPPALAVGRHFELHGVICAPSVQTLPATLRVDADMPAHRHGMNYRATTTLQSDGQFSSRGLLLHMPGRWRFIFDIGATRLSYELDVP